MPEPRANVKNLAPYTPGLSIAEIRQKYDLPHVIKLASNENPLGTSPRVAETIARMASSTFRYPQSGNPALVHALAEKYGVAPQKIVVGNGSDEIIDLLIRILAEPGRDNIVCFNPCFSIYPVQAKICDVECIRQPLEKDFTFDFQKLLDRVNANTRLVFVTTPDNPSGYLPPLWEVRRLAEELAGINPDAFLVIDEAYMDFAPDEAASSLLYNLPLPDNTAILRTFSKSYGLAGLRIGYAVLPENLADAFWRTRLPFSLNTLAAEAALTALADVDFRTLTLNTVATGRTWLTTALRNMGCTVHDSAANFIMFSPPDDLDAQKCFVALLEAGIIIRPLKNYGLPDKLRVSVGNETENRAFIDALKKIIA